MNTYSTARRREAIEAISGVLAEYGDAFGPHIGYEDDAPVPAPGQWIVTDWVLVCGHVALDPDAADAHVDVESDGYTSRVRGEGTSHTTMVGLLHQALYHFDD